MKLLFAAAWEYIHTGTGIHIKNDDMMIFLTVFVTGLPPFLGGIV